MLLGNRLRAAVAADSPKHAFSNKFIGLQCLPSAIYRQYATTNTLAGTNKLSSRKQVTIGNDDGRVPWGQLSTGEKAARTTQQTFNFGVIVAGAVGLVRRFILSLRACLTQIRLLSATIFTSMFSPPTARPDTSIALLTGSE